MAQKITKNQLKRLINEVLSEGGFYNPNHPIDDETQSKFLSACNHIIYPPGSNEPPLDEDEFMDIITKLGKWCYDDITAEYWHDQHYDNKDIYEENKLSEGKRTYYHIIEYGDYGNIGYQGYYDTEQEARERIAELEDMFPDVSFQIFPTDSRREPPITTV